MFTNKILIITSPVLLSYVSAELSSLGFPILSQIPSGIETTGTLSACMTLNMHLRTANRVLLHCADFDCSTPEELYNETLKIAWEDYIDERGYISISSNVYTPSIRNTQFANVKCKDAIVDRIAQARNRRPDSGSDKDKTVIYLYWNQTKASLYLDTSGEVLSKRGYRKIPGKAPVQESIAAGALYAAGWNGMSTFINPMCGSGTFAIEAALLGLKRAPGLTRDNYGFMHVKSYDPVEWTQIREKARDQALTSLPATIIASDNDDFMIDAARHNARAADVEQHIEFHLCSFERTPVPPEPGVIMVNPEYGVRLGNEKDLGKLYEDLGNHFKRNCTGYTAYILTGNQSLAKKVGLRPQGKIPFSNAQIPCTLYRYVLYKGSLKSK